MAPEAQALRAARQGVGVSVIAVLGLTALAGVLPGPPALAILSAPAGLLGLVIPAMSYRLYLRRRESLSDEPDRLARCRAYVRASVNAVGLSALAALPGLAAYSAGKELRALFGVATLVLLTGALWPTSEKLDAFVGPQD